MELRIEISGTAALGKRITTCSVASRETGSLVTEVTRQAGGSMARAGRFAMGGKQKPYRQ
jgi:hypothetical protein